MPQQAFTLTLAMFLLSDLWLASYFLAYCGGDLSEMQPEKPTLDIPQIP